MVHHYSVGGLLPLRLVYFFTVFFFVCVCFSDVQSLERILEQIVTRVNNDSTVRFNIIRRNVWDGASRAMGRSNFSPEKKIDVKFTDDYGISEGAVDNGGPTREFFRLCLCEVKDKLGIFEGPPNAKVLTCNSKGTYDLINCCHLIYFTSIHYTSIGL